MYMDKVKLIDLVKENPGLWDHRCPQYQNRDTKPKIWQEIGITLNVTGDSAKKTWETLRDMFRRELKWSLAVDNTPKWPHFQPMLFLKDVILSKQPQYTQESESLSALKADNEIDIKPPINQCMNLDQLLSDTNEFLSSPENIETSHFMDPSYVNENKSGGISENAINNAFSRKRRDNDENEDNKRKKFCRYDLGMKNKKKYDDIDDDYHFLMSLLPYFKKMDDIRKLNVRMNVMSIIVKELNSSISSQNLKINKDVSINQQIYSDVKIRNRHNCLRYSPISSGASSSSHSAEHENYSNSSISPVDRDTTSLTDVPPAPLITKVELNTTEEAHNQESNI